MPLFRPHRFLLKDSLKATKIVKNIDELREVIIEEFKWPCPIENCKFIMIIEAYPTIDSCFDKRTGWYTHIITVNIYDPDKFVVAGFLSESLDDYDCSIP
jgi:hypothetical protein